MRTLMVLAVLFFQNPNGNITPGGVTGPSYLGRALTTPLSSAFTWVNQGSATVTDDSSLGMILRAPAASADNHRALVQSVGATFTLEAAYIPTIHSANYSGCGVFMRNSSTGRVITFANGNDGGIGGATWTTVSSYNGLLAGTVLASGAFNQVVWVKVVQDATNRRYYVGKDRISYLLILTELNTAWTTPNQIGVFANSNNGSTYDAVVTVVHWSLT